MRIKMHRKERDEWLAIGTAVIYIKDSGTWRQITKSEMDVLEIQSNMTIPDSNPLLNSLRIDFPRSEEGNDGDYYALLYPLSKDGEFWDGEVWTA